MAGLRRLTTMLALFGVLAADAAVAKVEADKPEEASAAAPSFAGRYVRRSPAFGEMTLRPQGGEWRIEVTGSAHVVPAWRTPADCTGVAVGRYSDGRIVGHLRPFENEAMSLSEEAIRDKEEEQGRPGTIVVAVSKGRAVIVSSDAEGFCGLFSDLTGVYVRAAAQAESQPRTEYKSDPAVGKTRERAMSRAWAAGLRPENVEGSCRAKIGDKPARALANYCKANALLYAGACEADASCGYLAQEAWSGCRISRSDQKVGAQSKPDPAHLPCASAIPWEDWDIYER